MERAAPVGYHVDREREEDPAVFKVVEGGIIGGGVPERFIGVVPVVSDSRFAGKLYDRPIQPDED